MGIDWSTLSGAELDRPSTAAARRTAKFVTGGLDAHLGGELMARRMLAGDSVAGRATDATLNAVRAPNGVELGAGEALYRKLKLQDASALVEARTGVTECYRSAGEDFAKVAASLHGIPATVDGSLARTVRLGGACVANFGRRHKNMIAGVTAAKIVVAAPLVFYFFHEQKKHDAANAAAVANVRAAQQNDVLSAFVPNG